MSWWKDWGRYAATGLSVVGGVAAGILTANPLIGIGVAAAGLGATGLVENFETNDAQLDISEQTLETQKKDSAIQYITDDMTTVIDSLTKVDSYLTEVQKAELQMSDNEYNIGVNNEWLSMYQGMLNGDDNLLSQEKNILQSTLDLQRESAELYRQTSEYEKSRSIDQGYGAYAEMMKQKSLANVMAGTYGGNNAYTVRAMNIQNDIRKFVGDDLMFNSDGEHGAGEGTFLKEFGMLSASFDLKMKENDILIATAQLKLDQALDSWDTQKNRLEHENEDLEKSNKIAQENIDIYLSTVDILQDSAIEALKDYKKNAVKAGKDMKSVNTTYDKYMKAIESRKDRSSNKE